MTQRFSPTTGLSLPALSWGAEARLSVTWRPARSLRKRRGVSACRCGDSGVGRAVAPGHSDQGHKPPFSASSFRADTFLRKPGPWHRRALLYHTLLPVSPFLILLPHKSAKLLKALVGSVTLDLGFLPCYFLCFQIKL